MFDPKDVKDIPHYKDLDESSPSLGWPLLPKRASLKSPDAFQPLSGALDTTIPFFGTAILKLTKLTKITKITKITMRVKQFQSVMSEPEEKDNRDDCYTQPSYTPPSNFG